MRLVTSFSIFLVTWLFTFVISAHAVRNNTPAPDFCLKDLNGKKIALSDQKGRVLILNFWSTTCPPCMAELPSLNTLYHDLARSGLMVLGIALDPSDSPVRPVARHQHIEYPLLMDSSQEVYFDAYGLFGQPVSILIDRAGMVREKFVGQVDWAAPAIRAKITTLLKER